MKQRHALLAQIQHPTLNTHEFVLKISDITFCGQVTKLDYSIENNSYDQATLVGEIPKISPNHHLISQIRHNVCNGEIIFRIGTEWIKGQVTKVDWAYSLSKQITEVTVDMYIS